VFVQWLVKRVAEYHRSYGRTAVRPYLSYHGGAFTKF
jgi:hypothetical protein